MVLKKAGLIILVGLLLAGLVFLAAASWFYSSQLEKAVAEALSQEIGQQISLGKIEPALFNQVVVKDLRVKLKGEDQTFLQAEKIKIYYSWRIIWQNFAHFPRAIEKIVLVHPQVRLERDQEGKSNYEKFFPLPQGKKKEFSEDWIAKLSVERGEIWLQDAKKQIKNLHLTGVEGDLDLKNNPKLEFQVLGQEGKSRLRAQGYFDLTTQKVSCQLQIEDFSLAVWRNYLPQDPVLTVTEGRVDARLKVWGYFPSGLTYQGKAAIVEGKIKSRLVPLPIERIAGQVEIKSNRVSFRKIQGFLGQSPVQLVGSVYLSEDLLLDLDLQSPNLIIEEIGAKWIPELKQIKREGPLRAQIAFLGPLDRVQAWGKFYLTKGRVYEQKVNNFQLDLVYQDKQVRVEKAETLWQGGSLKAQGLVAWATKEVSYNFTLLADNLPVNSLPLQEKNLAELQGKLKGSLLISGVGKQLKVGGLAQLSHGSWRKIAFSQARACFFWEQGNLDLKYLLLDGPNLAGKVAGTINKENQLNLQTNLPVLNLEKLAGVFSPGLDLKGKGSFSGSVGGTVAAPFLEGAFKAWDGSVFQQDFQELSGQISFSDHALALREVELRDGVTHYKLQGEILLAGQPVFNLTLESKGVRVEKLLRLAKSQQSDFKGRLNGSLTLQGTREKLQVFGEAELTQGAWKDEEIDKAKIKFRWQDNLLHLDQVHVQKAETFLSGKIKFNSQKEATLAPLIIVRGKNSYRLTGKVDLNAQDPTMNLLVLAERSDLSSLSALLPREFKQPVTGTVEGRIFVWGSLNKPQARAMLDLTQAKVGTYPVEKGKIDLVWRNEELRVVKFRLTAGEGFVAAQGKVDFKGEAQLDLAAQGLEGALLSQLFDSPEKIKGVVNLAVQVRGKTLSPRIACSLDVSKGQVRETTFDRLYGLAIWENGIANLQQLILKKGQYQLSARGKIPTDAKGTQKIDLKVKMEQGDLGLLTIFLDQQLSFAQGAAQAELEVGGTWKAPLIKGELKVEQGRIKPKDLLEPLEDLEARLLFHQDSLELEYCRGKIGGGSFWLRGKGENLFSPLSQLDFQLKAENLQPKSKIFQGRINGQLFLTGPLSSPLLKGQLSIAKGLANIPLSILPGQGVGSSLRLDIGVKIGDNLRVKAMLTDLFLQGGMHLGGTLEEPKLQGTLTSKKGTITYLETRFRLVKGLIEFKEQNGFLPTLDLLGKTRYQKTAIYLAVTGQAPDFRVKFSSEPSLTEREILLLLTLRGEPGQLEPGMGKIKLDQQLARIAGETLPLAFLQDLSETLGNKLNLDEFYISQSLWKGPQITLGKYLWEDKVYLSYTLNTYVEEKKNFLGQEEKWYLEAQYKINKNLSLNYSHNSLGENELMLTTSVSF